MRRRLRNPGLVVVTGAGSGIGRATARAFGDDGATVIVADINDVTADETVDLIRERGGRAHPYHLDVADPLAWETFADVLMAAHGVPDVLVNNAGIAVIGGFLQQSAAEWERQLSINLMGVIHGCRVIAPLMVQRGEGGHIVNIASVAAYSPAGIGPSYCVSKAGVRMLSECLRIELAPDGVGVTVICPGAVATGIVGAGELVDDLTGLPGHRVDRYQAIASNYVVRYGPLLTDPARVARTIMRSVRHNWAIVPVRPEAWLGYAVSRLSPGIVRLLSRQVSTQRRVDQVSAVARRLERLLPEDVVDTIAASDPGKPIDTVRGVVRTLRRAS